MALHIALRLIHSCNLTQSTHMGLALTAAQYPETISVTSCSGLRKREEIQGEKGKIDERLLTAGYMPMSENGVLSCQWKF
eukprot:1146583-Pelagomonas_calceolata.AAC.8